MQEMKKKLLIKRSKSRLETLKHFAGAQRMFGCTASMDLERFLMESCLSTFVNDAVLYASFVHGLLTDNYFSHQSMARFYQIYRPKPLCGLSRFIFNNEKKT